MPSDVRSVRADVEPVRLRGAGAMLCVGLLSAGLALVAAPHAAEAQGFIARANTSRTVWVEFAAGGPNRNGFESARAPVEYHVYACRGVTPGAVLVRYRLLPDRTVTSAGYWYDGVRYEATARPGVRSAVLDATATSPAGEVGSLRREATPGTSLPADCETGGVNFSNLGEVSRFADPTRPAAVAQFLNTVTLSAEAMAEPLRDTNLERGFAQQSRAAEQAAADRAAAERKAAETRAAAERQAAQTQASGSRAGSQTPDSTGARPETAEQTAAAQQAARQEEARRAAEEAAEEARRQREREAEMVDAAVEVAGMAARTGGAFGAYYFTGGDTGNSLYKFNELTGLGLGLNFGPMILDVGQLRGTYSQFFVDDYADENAGALPESGEVDGMFVHVGLQLQKTFDSLRLGMSGGYLYGTTEDTEINSPMLGFIIGYNMLKFRVDAGLGDESIVGYALYLQF